MSRSALAGLLGVGLGLGPLADPASRALERLDATAGPTAHPAVFQGFGWNDLNARGLFHPGSMENTTRVAAIPPHVTAAWFDLMHWSGCDLVRVGWVVENENLEDGAAFEPANDDADPDHIRPEGFHFDSRAGRRLAAHLREYQKRSMRVLLCVWANPCPWLSPAFPDQGWELHPPTNAAEYAESVTALVKEFRGRQKFDNLAFFSLWNRPFSVPPSVARGSAVSPLDLVAAVDRRLRLEGLRDGLSLMPYEDAFRSPPPSLDGWQGATVHDFDTASALLGPPRRVDLSPWIRALGERPLLVSAYGSGGLDRKPVAGDDLVYDASLSLAVMVALHLNDGAAGFLRWCWSGHADASFRQPNHLMPLRFDDRAMLWRVHRPVYFPHAVQARYVKPGWRMWPVALEGGLDGERRRRLFAACASSPDRREWTVLAVNDSTETGHLRLSWPALSPSPGALHQIQVTGPHTGLEWAGRVTLHEPKLDARLPPRSIVTFTTLEPGDPKQPYQWEVGRGVRPESR